MPSVPKLETLARGGFAARGVVYSIIGFVALNSGRNEDPAGALEKLGTGWGRLLLALMALGLAGYGIWRAAEAMLDTEGHGSNARGIAERIGGGVSAATHIGLAFFALSVALQSSGGGGDGSREGARAALDLPGGELILLAVGGALLLTGAAQFLKAAKAGFLRHLDGRVAGEAWVKLLGRGGYAARGAVFLLTGWFVIQAGLKSDSSEAGGMAEALAAMSSPLRTAVAAGLLLFGLFSFVEGRYRRINDPHVLARFRAATDGARRTG